MARKKKLLNDVPAVEPTSTIPNCPKCEDNEQVTLGCLTDAFLSPGARKRKVWVCGRCREDFVETYNPFAEDVL